MRNFWLFTSFMLMLTAVTQAQDVSASDADLQIKVDISNPSREINNGVAKVNVEGGKAPYEYKWSNQSTALDAAKSTGDWRLETGDLICLKNYTNKLLAFVFGVGIVATSLFLYCCKSRNAKIRYSG